VAAEEFLNNSIGRRSNIDGRLNMLGGFTTFVKSGLTLPTHKSATMNFFIATLHVSHYGFELYPRHFTWVFNQHLKTLLPTYTGFSKRYWGLVYQQHIQFLSTSLLSNCGKTHGRDLC
jgi:hypothetical protein